MTQDYQSSQQPPPKPVALIFVGPILYPATKHFRNACCSAISSGAPELLIQISSEGGSTMEGFALYQFLRSLPVNLTIHNIDRVESIAVIVFLAARNRFCCHESRFTFHAGEWANQNPQTLKELKAHSLLSADEHARYLTILKSNTSISDKGFDELELFNEATIVDPSRAKEMGLVQEIKEASIPAGYSVWNVDF